MPRLAPSLLAVTAIVALGLLGVAGPAGAQVAALDLGASSVPAGGLISVSGTCDPDSSGYVLSDAFLGHGEFAGVAAVPFTTNGAGQFGFTVRIHPSVVPATYPVSARCGGANLGLSRSLRVVPARLVATGPASDHLVPVAIGLAGLGLAMVVLGRRRAVAA